MKKACEGAAIQLDDRIGRLGQCKESPGEGQGMHSAAQGHNSPWVAGGSEYIKRGKLSKAGRLGWWYESVCNVHVNVHMCSHVCM